jgi:hypothetical protein
MTIQQAAQTALDIQYASNASGVTKTLAGPVADAIWEEVRSSGSGCFNRHPIIALFLFKIGELNGCGISSLDPGYEAAEQACIALAAEVSQ